MKTLVKISLICASIISLTPAMATSQRPVNHPVTIVNRVQGIPGHTNYLDINLDQGGTFGPIKMGQTKTFSDYWIPGTIVKNLDLTDCVNGSCYTSIRLTNPAYSCTSNLTTTQTLTINGTLVKNTNGSFTIKGLQCSSS
jgi:hypothetical protein